MPGTTYQGQSTANFTAYSTTAPTEASTFTQVKDDGTYLCTRVPNRAMIHSLEVLVSHASTAITETSITVVLCRADNGAWPVLSLAIPITVVGAQTKAAGHKAVPDTARRYVNMGLTGETTRNGPDQNDSNALYAFVYGAVGGFNCRLIVHWEQF